MRHVLGYGGCYGENNYSVSKEVVTGMKLCAFMCSGIIVQGGVVKSKFLNQRVQSLKWITHECACQ